ncbi:MAG TPA: hypothetical protein VG275_04170 [Solirubrobacteraceae bacterium]|nr:hypothetical protein [Solirubrobacteraceae bacterium]
MASNEPPPPGAADGPSGPGEDEPGDSEPEREDPGPRDARPDAAGPDPPRPDPPGPDPPGPDAPGPENREPDALRRLEERLDRASDAAERLISEAAAQSAQRAAGARRPPPAGWQAPASGDASARAPDLDLLVHLLESLRDLIPPELQQRLVEALRELLLAVRALINWYLDRLDGHREEPGAVEDIPIDWD